MCKGFMEKSYESENKKIQHLPLLNSSWRIIQPWKIFCYGSVISIISSSDF